MKHLAQLLEVSPRTLRNWKAMAKEGHCSSSGRPSTPIALKLKYVKLVRCAWLKLGKPGSRPVCVELKGVVPIYFVRMYVAQLKSKRRKVFYRYKRENANKYEVIRKNTVWTQDGTHLGRLKRNAKAVEGQVIKDRGTLKIIDVTIGHSANQNDIIKQLRIINKERGFPLVFMTDNGSCYTGEKVERFLRENKVVHMKNMPNTPQHNGAAESCMRELKKHSMLGKGVVLESNNECIDPLTEAVRVMNCDKRYGSKKYRTSNELEESYANGSDVICREKFYEQYLKFKRKIDDEACDKRTKRMLEREMIYRLLEENGLLNITRGRALNRQIKRNIERFPEDFMFQLSKTEMKDLRQSVSSFAKATK